MHHTSFGHDTMEMPWFLDMSHSNTYIFTISTIGTIPSKNGDSTTMMTILWNLHPNVSSKLPLHCYCEFSQKHRLCRTHLQKVLWYYHCILGSTVPWISMSSRSKGKVRGHLKLVCNNLSSFSSSPTSVLCGSQVTFSKQMH